MDERPLVSAGSSNCQTLVQQRHLPVDRRLTFGEVEQKPGDAPRIIDSPKQGQALGVARCGLGRVIERDEGTAQPPQHARGAPFIRQPAVQGQALLKEHHRQLRVTLGVG